jgi:hypothetical protein
MRLPVFLAALAALLFASPAAADITARYGAADGRPVVVRVNDGGDSRTDVKDASYLTLGGVDYVVSTRADREFVVRLDDFTNFMARLFAAAHPSPRDTAVTIVETGTETVAGRTGRVFRIGEPGRPQDAVEIVISAEAELAPLGRTLFRHFGAMITSISASAPRVGAALRDVLGRGTLLRLGGIWRLESIDGAPIPPSTFALPSAPIGPAELPARLGAPPPS